MASWHEGGARPAAVDRGGNGKHAVAATSGTEAANTLLAERMLFGSDHPLITPERWLADFEEAGFKDRVKPGILKSNAMRLLGLGPPSAAA